MPAWKLDDIKNDSRLLLQTAPSNASSTVNNNANNVYGIVTKYNNPNKTGVSNVSYHNFSPNAAGTTPVNTPYQADNIGATNRMKNDLLSAGQQLVNLEKVYHLAENAKNQQGGNGTNPVNPGNGNGGNGGGNVLDLGLAPSQSADYMAQLSAMLQAQQAQQQAQLQANQAAHQALVEQAYQNNMNALLSAYGNQYGNLSNIYNNTLGQLESNYMYGADKIAQDRENALREAYVNRMMSQKNLPQQLNAAGLNGGAAESAVAQLLNNYGNARNSIETQSMNDLANLLNQYQNNANSAGQQYAQALNDLEANNYNYQAKLNNDLTSGVIGTYDDLYKALNSGTNTYANAMQGLASNLVGNAADLAAANYKNYANAVAKAGSTSATSAGTDNSTLANIKAQIASGNYDLNQLLAVLTDSGMSGAEAVKQLRALGANI